MTSQERAEKIAKRIWKEDQIDVGSSNWIAAEIQAAVEEAFKDGVEEGKSIGFTHGGIEVGFRIRDQERERCVQVAWDYANPLTHGNEAVIARDIARRIRKGN